MQTILGGALISARWTRRGGTLEGLYKHKPYHTSGFPRWLSPLQTTKPGSPDEDQTAQVPTSPHCSLKTARKGSSLCSNTSSLNTF